MSHHDLLPIPPIETASDPVYSAADLRQRWRALMGPLGFEERLLWFGLIGPDAVAEGELRFRNPAHPAAKSPALAPAILSST